jgi:hypothetical protein
MVRCKIIVRKGLVLNVFAATDRAQAALLRWGPTVPAEIGSSTFDIVLGSDLMYKESSFDALFQVSRALIKTHSESRVIVCYVFENQVKSVTAAAEANGFQVAKTERYAIDIGQIKAWQVLDYGEECILQEFILSGH